MIDIIPGYPVPVRVPQLGHENISRAGEMAEWLRTMIGALPEDPVLISSIHVSVYVCVVEIREHFWEVVLFFRCVGPRI